MRGKKWWLAVATVAVVLPVTYLLVGVDVMPHVEYAEVPPEPGPESELLPPSAYGIPMAGFVLEQGKVRSGATFSDMLGMHGVPMSTVQSLVDLAEPYFDVRRMRSGHAYAFIFADDNSRRPAYFVYEADPVEYVVFGLQDSLSVRTGTRPVVTSEHSVSVAITGALYKDLDRAEVDPALAVVLSEIFAWTVDFYRIQKNDVFTLVFAERKVDGQRYGTPRVLAARYTSGDRVQEAFRFDQDQSTQFFDAEGKSLRKAFLKAPVKFSRITSGYSSKRLHPVQKVMKAHLGTDYAAPYGTPILSVGDGVVEVAGRTSGNGHFVKVRHNGTYSTQYLHMRKILVKQGQRVQQGDVLGEVGSTGLATGPHVCFRFWKNGVQVDPRREEFPSAEPVASEMMIKFQGTRDLMSERLDTAELAQAQGRVINF